MSVIIVLLVVSLALGLSFLGAAQKLTQAIPDRVGFVADQLSRRDAHGRAIAAFALSRSSVE